MKISDDNLLRMMAEVRQEAIWKRPTNSEVINALNDERRFVQNIAQILADRRGIQIVNDATTSER